MIRVNHVMSADIVSKIFDDILLRISQHAPTDVEIVVSEKTLPGMDVYHFHRPHLEPRLPSNSVTTIHHDPLDSNPWVDSRDFIPRYREAAVNICLNTQQENWLRGLGIDGVEVLPHGFDEDVFDRPQAPRSFDGSRKICLGFVSKFYIRRVKGEPYLVDLMKRLDPQSFRFVFVGEGRWRDADIARGLGFESVHYERLAYPLFGQLYNEMDALMITSLNEGGPASVPEAMASAVPVISTRVGMCIDMVAHGEDGLFLNGDIEADARMISQLSSGDGEALSRLFQGAHAASSKAMGWGDVFQRHFDIYRAIVENG